MMGQWHYCKYCIFIFGLFLHSMMHVCGVRPLGGSYISIQIGEERAVNIKFRIRKFSHYSKLLLGVLQLFLNI